MKKLTHTIFPLLLILGVALGGGYTSALLYHPATANTYPTTVKPGDTGVYVEIPITNHFTYNYVNISTKLDVQPPFEGIKTENFIKQIAPGERKSLFYKINVDPNAEPGEYLLNHYLNYSYTEYDEDGNPHTYNITAKKVIILTVHYSESLEITSVGFDPVEIKPGEETTLSVEVKNTGTVLVNDISVSYSGFSETRTTVSATGSTTETKVYFVPLETTRKMINSLAPGESKTVSFRLRSVKDADVKAYQMTVAVAYGDETLSDSAVVNVVGEPDIRLAGFQSEKETILQGQQFSLSVQMENIGTGSAKSVKAELIDGNITGITTSYIGTIDPEDTGTAIFSIVDNTPGKHVAKVKVYFEDEYGNTDTREYAVEYVITKRPPDYTTPILVILVFLGLIYYIYRRYRRKKELEELVK